MCITFPTKKTSYPCISTQIARHGCHFCPCRSLIYCFSVSRLIHKTETTGRAIERTSHTNLSYSIISCRAADAKLPAAVRHGNDTVFLFLSEFSNCLLSISFNLRPSRQSGSCSRFIALPILVLSTIISRSYSAKASMTVTMTFPIGVLSATPMLRILTLTPRPTKSRTNMAPSGAVRAKRSSLHTTNSSPDSSLERKYFSCRSRG